MKELPQPLPINPVGGKGLMVPAQTGEQLSNEEPAASGDQEASDDQNQDEKRHKGIADDDHRTTRPPGRPHGTGCSRDIIRLQGRTRAARRDAFRLHAGSTTSIGPAITGCRSPSRASGRQLRSPRSRRGLAAPLRSNKWSV